MSCRAIKEVRMNVCYNSHEFHPKDLIEFSLSGDTFCRILQHHEKTKKKSSGKMSPSVEIEHRASDLYAPV